MTASLIGMRGSNLSRFAGVSVAGARWRNPERSEEISKRWQCGSNSVVESQPSKLLVAGSIPVSRSRSFVGWCAVVLGEAEDARRIASAAGEGAAAKRCGALLKTALM